MRNLISEKKLKEFDEKGYILIDPEIILQKSDIYKLNHLHDKFLPKYQDGKIKSFDKKFRYFNLAFNQELDSRIKTTFTNRNIKYDGCALRHSFLRGNGSILKELDDNIYYGKRGVLADRFFNKDIVNYVEHSNILSSLAEIFGTSDLSFHNGSLAAVYPGCVGEPGQFHIDTPGFTPNRNELLTKDKFLINVFIFLTDITQKDAPMRIIPESHNHYTNINNALSKSYNRSRKLNNVPQAEGELWEELLPNNLKKPINLIGKKGTVVFMRSDLLHAATENESNLTRKVMILNFSKRADKEFSKKIYHDSENCLKLFSLFKDKNLAKRTFYESAHPPIKYYVKKGFTSKKNLLKRNWRIPFRPIKRFFKKNFSVKVNIKDKNYLNIGAGPKWRHKHVIGIDYDPDLSEIALDLNYKKSLPFTNNSFKGIYSSHCLEHLTDDKVLWWLKESYRTLKINGILRITVPDIKEYLIAYDRKDAEYFDWIRGEQTYRFDSWLRLIVRAFAEPVVDKFTDKELKKLYKKSNHENFLNFFTDKVNKIKDEKYLIPGCHKSWWSTDKMTKYMRKAGFKTIKITKRKESMCKIFNEDIFNNTCPTMSFYIEAVK